jgi:hypothetical protein
MTQGQIEGVQAEALVTATPAAGVEAVSVDLLSTAVPATQAEGVSVDVLTAVVGTTQQIESLTLDVLALSPLPTGSNVFTSDGVEHQVYRWDGSALIFVRFGL